MKRKWFSLISLLLVAILVISACGPTEAPAPTKAAAEPTKAGEATKAPEPTKAEAPAGEAVEIRWFIGLGAGGNPEEIEKEEVFVEAFNAKYGDQYKLVMDIVPNETAYDVLKTQIASGDVPDIVGPVGVRGLWSFEGAWLDLTPQIEKTSYDLSDFNPALVDFYKLGPQGQVGLPFAVYPSALWYNKDLFDEAGLDYPPHEFGAPYADGDEWTFDKLRDLAMFLTVDGQGNDATMAEFDPDDTVQFGYHPMWTDIRGQWTFFGAGSFADADGKAYMPDIWREAAHWYYDGMWTDHFIPTENWSNSDLLAQGNTFGSGNVAMNPNHTWYTCCPEGTNWDVAAIPSYEGNITAKLHADTFGILKATEHPDEAFQVLSLMLGEFAPELLQVYGGLPARESLQESALATMAESFPDADLDVFLQAMSYPDNPNHESGMPNFLKASDTYATFASAYANTPDLDLDAEIDDMIEELQAVFDEVEGGAPAPTAVPEPTATLPPVAEKVEIRWFIGLGAGGNPEEIEKEEVFVEAFNAKYGDRFELVMDIVPNETAYDVLKTQIASGDVPDIVGPVGVRGLWSFEGAWLDLTPQIEKTSYDLSDFNPALVDFYKLGPQGQVGLPFAVYPSALWYNKDLFDEAGLEYPPHEFGAPYADGDEWTFDKLRDLAMFLTVDGQGNDATMAEFDPDDTVQFGYHPMWTDIRGQWTFFGAGSFADADGKAYMPDIWREAAHWYYDGMWTDHFIPTENWSNSDLLAQGNTFGSGNVAMNPNHTWYTCCPEGTNWDVAAIPSYEGNITAKLHADTFGILKATEHPDEAFQVLSLMLGEFAPELLQVYGGLPARESLQESALATMAESFPDADLDVFLQAMSYPDNPNHESGMPNFLKASDTYATFASDYANTPGLDLDAEIDKMIEELQAVFDEVE